MAIMFYGLKTCDTCRKALKALEAAGQEVDNVDVRGDGVPEATLSDWVAQAGIGVLLNVRSTTWRGLSDAEKTSAETAEGAVALLRAHPTLMKRPVIVVGQNLHVGWSKDVQKALL